MKKLIMLISVIIIFFVFFLYMYFSPRNYEKEYEINKVKITEKYNKEKEYYYFNLYYKEKNFEYVSKDKYTNKRGLIKDIEVINEDKILCLKPESEYITTYPLCYENDSLVDYNLVDIDFDNKKTIILNEDSYRDININYLNNKTFLIWTYKGFNYINKEIKKEINFLKNDSYNLDLVAQVNNYLLIPDYDNKYTFNKLYIINLENGNIEDWNLKYDIYFDSYIVGIDNKSVFLFDKKNEIEYELRPDKKKMRKVKYKAIINDEWQNLSLGDLNKEIKFSKSIVYNYEVTNNKLYLKYLNGKESILVSDKKVKDIVAIDNDIVYYIVEDKLYMYSPSYGEVLLMDYFEWNFNYKNMIYIY